MTIEQCNEKLRNDYGQNIIVQIKTYIEDDNSMWYYYTSAKYGDSDAFETIKEAYDAACLYLSYVGELW